MASDGLKTHHHRRTPHTQTNTARPTHTAHRPLAPPNTCVVPPPPIGHTSCILHRPGRPGRCSVPPWPARLLKGTTAPVSDRSSTPGGGHNTRHPTGIRIVVLVLALAALVLGPLGYLMGLRADPQHGTAAEWFTLAFGAAVGIPLLAAAVSTVAGDRKAALWSLALLIWPLVFVSALHLTNLGG